MEDPNDLFTPPAPGEEHQTFQQFDDILTAALEAAKPPAEATTDEREKRKARNEQDPTLRPRAKKVPNTNKEKQASERVSEKQKRKKEKEAAALAEMAAVKARRAASAAEKAADAAEEAQQAAKQAEVPRVSEPPTPQPLTVQEMMDRLNQTTTPNVVPPTDDLAQYDAQLANNQLAKTALPKRLKGGPVVGDDIEKKNNRLMQRLNAAADALERRQEEGFRPYSARLMDMEQALRREVNPYAAAHEIALDRARQSLARLPPAPPKLNVIDVDPQVAPQQQANRNRPRDTPIPPSVAPRGSVLRSKPAHSTPSPAAVAAAAGVAAAALNARNRPPPAESAASTAPAQLSATSQILISPNAPTPQQPMESASTALAVSNPTAHHMTVPSAVRMCDTSLDINPTQWTLLHKAAFEMIEQSLPNLSPSERAEICDAFYKITHKKNGKGNKPKEPKLEALNRVALRAAELEANRMRVVFGEKMRAIRKHRHGLVHHSNGGYTAQMASQQRVVPVEPGQKIRTRGWVQRDKGYVIRRVQRQAKASVVAGLGNKKRAQVAAIAANNRAQTALATLQAVAAGREQQAAAIENMAQ